MKDFSPWLSTAETEFFPTFDVKETKDSYVFKGDLPGLKEEDIDVALTGNRLTISGERVDEKRDEGEQYFAHERTYGTFMRAFTLPEDIDSEGVEAEFKDGVLNVVIPKKPEAQPKRIQLKGGSKTVEGSKLVAGRSGGQELPAAGAKAEAGQKSAKA